jgi:putative alpha-1,2-mannosidase
LTSENPLDTFRNEHLKISEFYLIDMTPRLSRRKFGALTAAAIPSFWVAGNWGLSGSEGPEGPASFINPLIGASTNQTLGEGKTFTIIARNQAADHCYVQSALNGEVLSRAWITHSEIVAGGTLEFVMDSAPNQEWAAADQDLPHSMTPRKREEKI